MHCTKFPCRSKNVHALGAGCNVFRQIDKEKSKKKKKGERETHMLALFKLGMAKHRCTIA